MTIRWRCEPFDCEYRCSHSEGWLNLTQADRVVARERASSTAAAYRRALELRERLLLLEARAAEAG